MAKVTMIPSPNNRRALEKLVGVGVKIKGRSFIAMQGVVRFLAADARRNKIFDNITSNLVNSIDGQVVKKGRSKTVPIKMSNPNDKPEGHPSMVTIKAEDDVTGVFYAGMEYAVHVENRDKKDVLTGTFEKNKNAIAKILGKDMKLSKVGF